jgi:hypothetical protein
LSGVMSFSTVYCLPPSPPNPFACADLMSIIELL